MNHTGRKLTLTITEESAMAMNRIQFQRGISLPQFCERNGSEEQCESALMVFRWPEGFRCPLCASSAQYVVGNGTLRLFRCRTCRQQTSLTVGALIDCPKLPPCTWFLAIFLVGQDKIGLSSQALMRHLGSSYRTAWLIYQKPMAAMTRYDSEMPLHCSVQVDEACLGGEHPGIAGRGSPDKVSIVAAV